VPGAPERIDLFRLRRSAFELFSHRTAHDSERCTPFQGASRAFGDAIIEISIFAIHDGKFTMAGEFSPAIGLDGSSSFY
jgi:hypothetical protein